MEYKHCAYGISYSAKGDWWMPGHSEVPNTFIPWDEINLLKYKSKSFGNAEIETDYFYLLAPEDFLDEINTYFVLFSYHASLFSGKAPPLIKNPVNNGIIISLGWQNLFENGYPTNTTNNNFLSFCYTLLTNKRIDPNSLDKESEPINESVPEGGNYASEDKLENMEYFVVIDIKITLSKDKSFPTLAIILWQTALSLRWPECDKPFSTFVENSVGCDLLAINPLSPIQSTR